MNKIYRHGDISLIKTKKMEGEVVNHHGSFVVAEGETTGHKHVIKVKDPNDLIIRKDVKGMYYFELLSGGTIEHEEHKTLVIKPGIYKESREREFNYFELSAQRVID